MPQRKRHYSPEDRSLGKACLYLLRALRLKCPICGSSSMFVPISRLKSLYDWFTPLDGCHRCGYPYEREAGYWLVPVWIIDFGVSAGSGAIAAMVAKYRFGLDLISITVTGSLTTLVVSYLFARHAKSLFLAIDQFLDPPKKN